MKNTAINNLAVCDYIESIAGWHRGKNLIDGSTHPAQFLKLIEEIGELAGNLARGRDIEDDIGDAIVVLINIAEREGVSIEQCLHTAWRDIKDRKGKMVEGVFVKDAE